MVGSTSTNNEQAEAADALTADPNRDLLIEAVLFRDEVTVSTAHGE